MLETLETLARQIAALRHFGERSGDARMVIVTERLAQSLTQILDTMAAQDGMLTGEMPWLKDFNRRSASKP